MAYYCALHDFAALAAYMVHLGNAGRAQLTEEDFLPSLGLIEIEQKHFSFCVKSV